MNRMPKEFKYSQAVMIAIACLLLAVFVFPFERMQLTGPPSPKYNLDDISWEEFDLGSIEDNLENGMNGLVIVAPDWGMFRTVFVQAVESSKVRRSLHGQDFFLMKATYDTASPTPKTNAFVDRYSVDSPAIVLLFADGRQRCVKYDRSLNSVLAKAIGAVEK